MTGRIDVRRTEGGLRLLVPVLGASPRRSVRLSYAQAGGLITAIRAGALQPGDLATPAEGPVDAEVRTALVKACAGTCLGDHDLQTLGDALSAHMPDRMKPLPPARSAPELN